MLAVSPHLIPLIDAYAADALGIPTVTLMQRAGAAVASAVCRARGADSRVLILCGGGNNGGDGYAAGALLLKKKYAVTAVDLFAKGQKSEAGKAALADYLRAGGQTVTAPDVPTLTRLLSEAEVVVDALFGTGFAGQLPPAVATVLQLLRQSASRPYLLAVDVPSGVVAETGSVLPEAVAVDETVMLSFPKVGLYSYPARAFCGRLTNDNLDLPIETIADRFSLQDHVTDEADAAAWLPPRREDSHKGSYGTLALFCGSAFYPGAALLACEAAHRTGVGLVKLYGEPSLLTLAVARRPETVVCPLPAYEALTEETAAALLEKERKASAILVGCGCGQARGLALLLRLLLQTEGAPLILDADALNVLSDVNNGLLTLLKASPRAIAMTPHPLEFSRLTGSSVAEISAHRLEAARRFACEYQVTLLLKGAGTVIAAPNGSVTLNTTGNSALSKGGSGDVLAGAVGSFVAQGLSLPRACALAAYLHGGAGEALSKIYSEYGTLPSELPAAIAMELKKLST